MPRNCADVVPGICSTGWHAPSFGGNIALARRQRAGTRRTNLSARPTAAALLKAHALLRWSLGLCLGVAPKAIAFAQSSHGKPELTYPEALGITFNLSHTDGLIALCACRRQSAGRDRRGTKAGRATQTLQLARNFCPRETAYVARMPRDQQTDAFLRLWTRKEAAHKADGRGLSAAARHVRGAWRSLRALGDLGPRTRSRDVGAVAWEARLDKSAGRGSRDRMKACRCKRNREFSMTIEEKCHILANQPLMSRTQRQHGP